jgi:hypothetical protein
VGAAPKLVNQIKHWVALRSRRPSYLRRLGAEVIDGLRFDTDEEWMEACYRHRDIINARQQEKANPEPVEPRKTLCSFCLEPRSPTRPLFRDGFIYICEPCATTAVEASPRIEGRMSGGAMRRPNRQNLPRFGNLICGWRPASAGSARSTAARTL